MSVCVCAKCKKPWGASGSPGRCPNCGEASFAIAIVKASPTTEYQAKMSVAMKKVWQDPEYQAKMKATRKKRWEDPEYRAKRRAAYNRKRLSS